MKKTGGKEKRSKENAVAPGRCAAFRTAAAALLAVMLSAAVISPLRALSVRAEGNISRDTAENATASGTAGAVCPGNVPPSGTGTVAATAGTATDSSGRIRVGETNVYISPGIVPGEDGGEGPFSQDGEMIVPTLSRKIFIRTGPGFFFPVLAVAERSSAFIVVRRGIWYEVRYGDAAGYVYGASFDTEGAYPAGRLAGLTVGIDPDGQVAIDSELEAISPGSSAMSPRMTERVTGRSTGEQDYLINMSVALALKDMLELEGAEAVLTKSDVESNMSNSARARFLNGEYGGEGCDIIIRLSCNSSDNTTSRGAVSLVRFGVSQEQYALAKSIIVNISSRTGIPAYGIRYTSDNTFLNWCAAPAISVEMGFLSNFSDERILAEESYQDQIAGAVRDSLVEFYGPER